MSRILVIEDNADLAFGLRNNLEIEGYEVEVSGDGAAGLERARRSPPDLVILDLMLPKLDGFRVLKAIRQDALAMPVLILTARGEEADKVRGLKLGADDYVTKPFGVLEILARVEALLRRRPDLPGAKLPGPTRGTERFGDVAIDFASRTVSRAGNDVEVAPKEYELLVALVRRRGPSSRAWSSCGRCGAIPTPSSAARSTRTSPSCAASSRRIPGLPGIS